MKKHICLFCSKKIIAKNKENIKKVIERNHKVDCKQNPKSNNYEHK